MPLDNERVQFPAWKDELGQLLASRIESPSSDIIQNTAEGSLTFKATARYPTDYITYNLQLNHDWLLRSEIEFHLHLWQTTAAVGNWLVGYRWQANGQAKVTAWTLKAWQSNAFTWTAGTLNQITDFRALTQPGTVGLSDIVQIRLYRDYTNVSTRFSGAETNGLDMDVVMADIHRRSDAIGSRLEYVK